MAGRGGYQPPANPAAVSSPGSGARTDGGAGSKSQPIRVPSGGAYGERKSLTEQQQGAPLATGQAPMAAASPQGGAPPPQAMPEGGIFGPTTQPTVQPQGDPNDPRMMAAQHPDMVLRVLYSQYPTAALGALLRRGGVNG